MTSNNSCNCDGTFHPSLAVGEEMKINDLVETDGLYCKKFITEPFTGKVVGNIERYARRENFMIFGYALDHRADVSERELPG